MQVVRTPVLLSCLSLIILIGTAQTAHAQFQATRTGNPCPQAGEELITSQTRPLARAAGIPDSSLCWKPSDAVTGERVATAKQYLRGILCSADRDNYGGMGPDGTISGLDGQFAVCAASFLQSARNSGINVCIREGARSVAKQNEYVQRGVLACKRGAQCEHPRGIAIDVNVRPNVNDCASYRALHQSAGQFGLTFYLGCKDAYHFVPQTSGCNAGGVIQREQFDFPEYYPVSANPFTNPLKNGLMPPTPAAMSPAQQHLPISNHPFTSEATHDHEPISYSDLFTLPTTTPSQATTTPTGTSTSSTPIPPTTTPATTVSQQVPATTTPVPAGSSQQSVIDQLLQYAGTGSSAPTGTSAPVVLNPELTQSVAGTAPVQVPQISGEALGGYPVPSFNPGTTFSTEQNTNVNMVVTEAEQRAFISRLLDQSRAILTRILEALTGRE